MTGPALHEDEDHALGAWPEMWSSRRERMAGRGGASGHKTGERQIAETARDGFQRVAAGDEIRFRHACVLVLKPNSVEYYRRAIWIQSPYPVAQSTTSTRRKAVDLTPSGQSSFHRSFCFFGGW